MITKTELAAARKTWGDALIAISKAFEEDGISGAREIAKGVLDTAYGYDFWPVLFKPTLASGNQTFRTTKVGALAYFVGHDVDYPNDSGFGIKSWRKASSETAAIHIDDDIAMWMGRITLTDKNGQITDLDKSFGYRKDDEGNLRIILHHSSVPYKP